MPHFDDVLNAIDAYNRQDPKTIDVDGQSQPYEWKFSNWLSEWVDRLMPNASESLRIAARGQHIGRWTLPRESYPMDRGGYLRWREDLKKFHAQTVGALMAQAGYGVPEIERTQAIILKKNFRNDPEAQTMEDALCLVFLEYQFPEFRRKTPDDKMIDILRKSWRKMSESGRKAALTISFGIEEKALIEKALAA